MSTPAVSGLALVDAGLTYLRLDAAWAEFTGRPVAAHLGRTLAQATPEVAPVLAPLVAQVAAAGAAVVGSDVVSSVRAARVDALPLRDADGSLAAVALLLAPDARLADLVARISARFIDVGAADIDAGIHAALAAMGAELGAGRAQVACLAGTPPRAEVSHGWSAPGAPAAGLGADLARLAAGEEVVAAGAIAMPLTVEQQVIGTLAFAGRGFGADAVAHVRLLAEIIACALHRKRTDTAVRERIGFEQLLATLSSRLLAAPGPELDAVLAEAAPYAGHGIVARMVASAVARRQAEDARRAAFDELARLKASVEHERDYLREEIACAHQFGEILGVSPALRAALNLADAVARTNATVLVCGESGVGKELFARAIHGRSGRAGGPLVKVNCANIPKDLFESEFFGHVRGAFTGAHRDRTGRFEMAHGGTIFLDEIGEIPLELQAKLLRILQEGSFERVGDDATRRVDVRVIAATNRDLLAEVETGRFRGDLYYRLSVFPITVPPLRARRDDIVPLAEHFLAQRARELGRAGLVLGPAERQRLLDYDWPGNVRELQHVIERAAILSPGPPLRLDLALAGAPAPAPAPPAAPALTEGELRALERANLEAALDQAGGRVAGAGGAAARLGVHPSTLRDRMRALGIPRREPPAAPGSVLILDDDADLRTFVRDVFQIAGARDAVEIAGFAELTRRGAEALACELAVLDLDLGPGLPTGVDACRWLREQGFRGAVAFLTGLPAGHPLVDAARAVAAARVLEKPVRIADLVALVKGGGP